MKIITTRFSKEEGKQLMKVRLSMGILDFYAIENIHGFAERLSESVPGISVAGLSSVKGQKHGTLMAEIFARVALALQTMEGLTHSYWKVKDSGASGNYDVKFSCSNEHMGEYVARAAFRVVRAALHKQRYSLAPDLNMLRAMNTTATPTSGFGSTRSTATA